MNKINSIYNGLMQMPIWFGYLIFFVLGAAWHAIFY